MIKYEKEFLYKLFSMIDDFNDIEKVNNKYYDTLSIDSYPGDFITTRNNVNATGISCITNYKGDNINWIKMFENTLNAIYDNMPIHNFVMVRTENCASWIHAYGCVEIVWLYEYLKGMFSFKIYFDTEKFYISENGKPKKGIHVELSEIYDTFNLIKIIDNLKTRKISISDTELTDREIDNVILKLKQANARLQNATIMCVKIENESEKYIINCLETLKNTL